MNILIISPVILLLAVQALSVSVQYKRHHQYGYSDYHYARYDLPRIEIRLPDNNRIFEDHFGQTIHGFQPFQRREFIPEFSSSNHDYIERHWPHWPYPMQLAPFDPFQWSTQTSVSMSFKIRVPTIVNIYEKHDGFVKGTPPTLEAGTIFNTNEAPVPENEPQTEVKLANNQAADNIKTNIQSVDASSKDITTKPEADKPKSVEKEITKSDTDVMKTDISKPDAKHDTAKPETKNVTTDKSSDNKLETNKPGVDIKPQNVTQKMETEKVTVIDASTAETEPKAASPTAETESPKETTNNLKSKLIPTEDVTKSENIESSTDKVGSSSKTDEIKIVNDVVPTQSTSIGSK